MFDFKNFLEVCNGVLSDLSSNDKSENIYHYTGIEGFKSIIEKREFRFTDRFYLNDKSEGTYILDLFIDNFDYIVSDTALISKKEELLSVIREYKENMQNKFFKIFQASFSINPDSLCMWNYYTKGNGIKGFNIGFDSATLCESIWDKINNDKEKPYVFSGKVIYNKDEQVEILKAFVTRIYNAIYKDVKEVFYSDIEKRVVSDFVYRQNIIIERITLLGVFFKKPCFDVEEEYRIAVDFFVSEGKVENTQKKIMYICKDNGFIVPHLDLDFDLKSVKEITVSPTMDFCETQNNLKAFLSGRGMDNISVNKSDIPVRF